MKFGALLAAILWPVLLAMSGYGQHDFAALKGPYLGQTPPDTTAVLFADGILANRYHSFHSSLMFSADGEECYWQAKLSDREWALVWSRIEKEKWTDPEIVPFSRIEYRDDCPFISPDGNKLFFISRRPVTEGAEAGKENIWVVDRKGDGWGNPEPLPRIINSMSVIHWQVSVDSQGNLYFGTYQMERAGRRGDIYCSRFVDGEYMEPERLGPNINSPDYEFSPFIAADGSYILFSRETYGVGICRILISFRDETGNWTEAKDLNELCGIKGVCPVVSNDGKYLFFLDYVNSFSQPFWVDAKTLNLSGSQESR